MADVRASPDHAADVGRQPPRRVWWWSLSGAVVGWVIAAVLLATSIPACGRAVIESGIVSDQVWANHLIVVLVSTAIAFAWVIAYSRWARSRWHVRTLDALVCLGFGATAWLVPWVALDFALGDHWSGGKPWEGIPPFGAGTCGTEPHLFAVLLLGGGLAAIAGWVLWAFVIPTLRRTPARERV